MKIVVRWEEGKGGEEGRRRQGNKDKRGVEEIRRRRNRKRMNSTRLGDGRRGVKRGRLVTELTRQKGRRQRETKNE